MSVTDRAFNPSDNPAVDEIKSKLIDLEQSILNLPAGRRRSVALTQLELAGMMAVKAAVVGDN